MARWFVVCATCVALIVTWLVLWPVGQSDCAPPMYGIICPQASTVGLPLEMTHSERAAIATLAAIAVVGALAFGTTLVRERRRKRRS